MSNSIQVRSTSVSDAAVDGLLAGVGAGVLMAVFLVLSEWLLAGASPLDIIARFDPSGQPVPLTGLFIHLAISAVYGLAFGIIGQFLGRLLPARGSVWPLIGLGALYGSLIFLIARAIFWQAGSSTLLGFSPVNFWLAHEIYGCLMAWMMSRKYRL